ncbi:class I SAM-dependent methyltransferase [Streptomyces sp. NBC_00433]
MTYAGPRTPQDTWVRLLEAHPRVAAARLLPGPPPRIEIQPLAAVDETVDGWSYLFEDLYDQGADRGGDAPARQLVGWIDGLTGKPVPEVQMREWTDAAVDRITALRPRRVLEIGAGTGLVMGALLAAAPLDEYVATDLAAASVRALRSIAGRAGTGVRVRVHQGAAHEGLPASESGGYDLVIVNSVAQYFPSVRYLEQVLGRAIGLMAPRGHLFLGDLRDATLLPSYYRQLAGDAGAEFDLERHQRRDFELGLSPAYVKSLAGGLDAVTAVEAAPKRGRYRNEMNVFRFDAVLHVGCPPPGTSPRELTADGAPVPAVRRHIESGGGPAVWRGLANARPGDLGGDAVDPEDLWALDGLRGWRVRVGCAPGSGCGALEVWAGPQQAPDAHFGLSLPSRDAAGATAQPALPAGRIWSLLDDLRKYLVAEGGTAAAADGRVPALQVGRLCSPDGSVIGQEGDRP